MTITAATDLWGVAKVRGVDVAKDKAHTLQLGKVLLDGLSSVYLYIYIIFF